MVFLLYLAVLYCVYHSFLFVFVYWPKYVKALQTSTDYTFCGM